MEQKRPSIPMQVQAFRRRHWRPSWPWTVAAALVALLLIWLVSRWPGQSTPQTSAPVSETQVAGPPWQMGNPEGRFTLTLYADLECPFCRSYFPVLKRWVAGNADVALQWHHLPLAAHEPAASAEARLAECAGEAGGHAAFWQAVEWVYAMPTRAATVRACPRTCATPTLRHPSSSASRASGPTRRFAPKLRKPRTAA